MKKKGSPVFPVIRYFHRLENPASPQGFAPSLLSKDVFTPPESSVHKSHAIHMSPSRFNLELKRQSPRSNRKGFYYQEIAEPPSSSEAQRIRDIEQKEKIEDQQWDALKEHIESGILPKISARRTSKQLPLRKDKRPAQATQYVPFVQERDDLGRLITERTENGDRTVRNEVTQIIEKVERAMLTERSSDTRSAARQVPSIERVLKKWENKKPENQARYSVDINKRIMHSKDTVKTHINLSKSKLSIDQPNSESDGEQQPVATLESSVVDGYFDEQASVGGQFLEEPISDLRLKVFRNDPPYSGYEGNVAFQHFKSREILMDPSAAVSRNTRSFREYLSLQEHLAAARSQSLRGSRMDTKKAPKRLCYAAPRNNALCVPGSRQDSTAQLGPGFYEPLKPKKSVVAYTFSKEKEIRDVLRKEKQAAPTSSKRYSEPSVIDLRKRSVPNFAKQLPRKKLFGLDLEWHPK